MIQRKVSLAPFLYYIMCAFRYRRPLEPGLKIAITTVPGNRWLLPIHGVQLAYCAQYYRHVRPRGVRCHRRRVRPRSLPHSNYDRRLLETAQGFQDKWNFPHVCGAIDGKHVAICKPKESGSIYYNYKGFFSIVILVLCDANYKAIWAHVGSPGSQSDCGIYNDSPMFQGIQDETIELPALHLNHCQTTLRILRTSS